ncbi:MAG: sugar transferase, partial [Lachnospiraceae bacterium]|nr:sugar transferase [Lachnospiraceae bacterium]
MERKKKCIDYRRLESFKRFINLLLGAVCLGLEISIFTYHWIIHFYGSLAEGIHYFRWGYVLEVVLYGVILFSFSKMYGGLRIGYLKNEETIFSKIFATVVANIIIYFELSLMANQLFMLRFFLEMTAWQIFIDIVWINIAARIYKDLFPPRKLLLIHGDRPVESILEKFNSRKDKYQVVNCINVRKGIKNICNELIDGVQRNQYHAVVLWDISMQERNTLLKFCYAHSVRSYIMPKIADVILIGAEELHLFDTPILLTREYSLTMEQRFLKRMIDIVFACILLILSFPFMLITAVAIKLCDHGPILYKQTRCTKNQKEFSIMKFRSMYLDAEKDGIARLSAKNDQRITPIGKWIRKVRLDELPQLFNILKGDMSFIGPRPERPEIIAQYVEIMPEFAVR